MNVLKHVIKVMIIIIDIIIIIRSSSSSTMWILNWACPDSLVLNYSHV